MKTCAAYQEIYRSQMGEEDETMGTQDDQKLAGTQYSGHEPPGTRFVEAEHAENAGGTLKSASPPILSRKR